MTLTQMHSTQLLMQSLVSNNLLDSLLVYDLHIDIIKDVDWIMKYLRIEFSFNF